MICRPCVIGFHCVLTTKNKAFDTTDKAVETKHARQESQQLQAEGERKN